MKRRSRAREVALQLLFQSDLNPQKISRKAIERFARDRIVEDPVSVTFCISLYDGVRRHQTDIDDKIVRTAENWRLNRMQPVDRNVIRMGAYEMLFAEDRISPAIAIDEAIELARRYGTADSPAFVNGILDKIAKTPATVEATVEAATESPPTVE